MQIAFYAPLKSPNSDVPSGDRKIARAFIRALEHKKHKVSIVSDFQSRDPHGSSQTQKEFKEKGEQIAESLIRSFKNINQSERPELWFTYHLYYKAVDWIGPTVSKELSIPYIAAEVSHAPKRSKGNWSASHSEVIKIIQYANIIFSVNSADTHCVLPLLSNSQKHILLRPFTDISPSFLFRKISRIELIEKYQLDNSKCILVTVAMMRDDAKLKSYELLGRSLDQCNHNNWQLLVVGDGPARDKVTSYLNRDNIFFLGQLNQEDINKILSGSDLFLWPAVDEAYGMAMLEAQMSGLPVISGRSGGVSDIVRHDKTGLLCDVGDVKQFSEAIDLMISSVSLRERMSEEARRIARDEHSIERAAEIINDAIGSVIQ
ncbi:MAG: glycosyl transferase [Rhodospirillaceae bacterium]|nr:glycosyl transferase [Rhodospirillaceae bacterium]OUT76544.1 MAG: hypothetical protein CBB83_10905 [Rhodospirillaceae bacterium TMED23]